MALCTYVPAKTVLLDLVIDTVLKELAGELDALELGLARLLDGIEAFLAPRAG